MDAHSVFGTSQRSPVWTLIFFTIQQYPTHTYIRGVFSETLVKRQLDGQHQDSKNILTAEEFTMTIHFALPNDIDDIPVFALPRGSLSATRDFAKNSGLSDAEKRKRRMLEVPRSRRNSLSENNNKRNSEDRGKATKTMPSPPPVPPKKRMSESFTNPDFVDNDVVVKLTLGKSPPSRRASEVEVQEEVRELEEEEEQVRLIVAVDGEAKTSIDKQPQQQQTVIAPKNLTEMETSKLQLGRLWFDAILMHWTVRVLLVALLFVDGFLSLSEDLVPIFGLVVFEMVEIVLRVSVVKTRTYFTSTDENPQKKQGREFGQGNQVT